MRFYLILFISFSLLFLSKKYSNAQCFASPGNPIAGSTNLGVLNKNKFRSIVFHKYSYLSDYLKNNKKCNYKYVSSANYNFIGAILSYGISDKFTAETEIGYFINKTQYYVNPNLPVHNGYGLSNALISLKYNIYKNLLKDIKFSLGAGSKLPFSTQPQMLHNAPLPVDVQPSTGNYGIVLQSFFVKEYPDIKFRFFIINYYEKNFNKNQQGYIFGDAYISSIFLSRHLYFYWTDLTKDITAILQFRHEYRERNTLRNTITQEVKPVEYSGSNLFFISPQLNYNLKKFWNISAIVDIPVYQYFNGIQLSNKFSFAFSVSKDFGFKE